MFRTRLPVLCLVVSIVAASPADAQLRVRRNYRSLTARQRQDFVDAIKLVRAIPDTGFLYEGTDTCFYKNRYDKYVCWHARCGCQSGNQHGRPLFLPWHRELLRRFELELGAVKPGVTLPYWMWLEDFPADTAAGDSLFMGNAGLPPDYKVTKGPFANWKTQLGDSLRRERASAVGLFTQPDIDSALAKTFYDAAPWNGTGNSANGFTHALENIHDLAHFWIGGRCGNNPPRPTPGRPCGHLGIVPQAVDDPAFWLHHCYVDCLYDTWQQLHAGIDHYLPKNGEVPGENLTDPMAPWNDKTPQQVLVIRDLGYRYEKQGAPVPVTLAVASAEATPRSVRIVWTSGERLLPLVIERSQAGGPWAVHGVVLSDPDGRVSFVDEAVSSGNRYGYRVRTDAGPAGEVWVTVPAFGLSLAARFDPGPGLVRTRFSLPRPGQVRLGLYDIAGRLVDRLDLGARTAGEHTASLGSGRDLSSGLYLVRLDAGGGTLSSPVMVVR